MTIIIRLASAGLLSAFLPLSAMAQDAASPPTPPPAAAPAEPATGNPNLSVATVKMDGGIRASKIIGASVNDSGNQSLGTVNDLILDKQGHAVLAVISTGAVLGVGGKLVAVPYGSIKMAGDGKVDLTGGSKDMLANMPSFTYTP